MLYDFERADRISYIVQQQDRVQRLGHYNGVRIVAFRDEAFVVCTEV
jgi:hypothetical protein